MYHLYIDESGDPGDYRDENGNVILRSSKFFTLAGIIVDDEVRKQFHCEYEKIMTTYFTDITLEPNFKLHYNSLRQVLPPFDKLSRNKILNLENDVFKTIFSLDCKLLSVTIDLDKHCNRYSEPIWPTALALLYLLERFHYFLDENQSQGIAIYERFTNTSRDKVRKEWNKLQSNANFPKPTTFPDLESVHNGDPATEPLLAFVDFFGYLPYMKKTMEDKWKTFTSKYYNFQERQFKSGHVEI